MEGKERRWDIWKEGRKGKGRVFQGREKKNGRKFRRTFRMEEGGTERKRQKTYGRN